MKSSKSLSEARQTLGALRETIWIALDTLRAHKLRTFLTLLGVILAVTTLVAVISVLNGLNVYVADKVANLGANAFVVDRIGIGDQVPRGGIYAPAAMCIPGGLATPELARKLSWDDLRPGSGQHHAHVKKAAKGVTFGGHSLDHHLAEGLARRRGMNEHRQLLD